DLVATPLPSHPVSILDRDPHSLRERERSTRLTASQGSSRHTTALTSSQYIRQRPPQLERERDLLALLPLRDLVATLLRLHPVVGQPRSYRWEGADGQGLIRACCGIRTLLHTLSRAMAAHARYSRLQRALSEVARNALHALAALDWQLDDPARNSYSPDLERKLLGELQAVFLSGLEVLSSEMHEVPASLLVSHAAREYCYGHMLAVEKHDVFLSGLEVLSSEMHEVPASLLVSHAAREYCYGHMLAVEKHDECFSHRVESLSLDLPRASCDMRVRVVSHAALRRRNDYELARMVLEFLFQVGVRRGKVSIGCKGACRQAAQECMSALLTAHPYLHAFALHLVAETNPGNYYRVEMNKSPSIRLCNEVIG
ncbi:hypothetical protein evm_015108, partial [Chilo suppressalis]